jgi:hypothetical protein
MGKSREIPFENTFRFETLQAEGKNVYFYYKLTENTFLLLSASFRVRSFKRKKASIDTKEKEMFISIA